MFNNNIVVMLLLSSMLPACGGSAVIGGEHETSSGALAALGKDLFFDTLLSLDQTVSCATCHKPEHGFADDAALSVASSGSALPPLIFATMSAPWRLPSRLSDCTTTWP